MRYQGVNSDGEPLSSAYVDKSGYVGPSVVVDFANTVSLTRQEFADECDINTLMAQYDKTGILPSSMNNNVPQYLDITDIPDYREALDMLAEASAAFMALPAQVRREFDNDALKFVEFAQDPENLPQMRTWGLAPPEKVPEPPMKVEVVSTPAPAEGPKAS